MKDILNNKYEHEFILIGARPAVGKTALLLKLTKDYLEQGKKVLFFSLEASSELLFRRMKMNDTPNLLINDYVIKDLTRVKESIQNFKPDVILIDYLQLLPQEIELPTLLKQISKENNIPVIVSTQISRTYDEIDLSQISIEEFKSISKSISEFIDESDTFSILYQKEPKVIIYKELKNTNGSLKEIDIREILN